MLHFDLVASTNENRLLRLGLLVVSISLVLLDALFDSWNDDDQVAYICEDMLGTSSKIRGETAELISRSSSPNYPSST